MFWLMLAAVIVISYFSPYFRRLALMCAAIGIAFAVFLSLTAFTGAGLLAMPVK